MNVALNNKLIVITGSSRGIGAAMLKTFASTGATVIGTATTESGADKISATLKEAGVKGAGMVLDVKNTDAITGFVEAVETQHGTPYALIHNAAVTRDNLMLRMKASEWDDVIATNLSGVYHLTKGFLRTMLKARQGRIIGISSVVATMGNPGQVNYCAAKAGLIGMMKSLAMEIGSRNITVNCIAPGFIATDMTDVLTDDLKKAYIDKVPLGRFGDPEEVAKLALFLTSEAAGYIHGQTIHINGGMWM